MGLVTPLPRLLAGSVVLRSRSGVRAEREQKKPPRAAPACVKSKNIINTDVCKKQNQKFLRSLLGQCEDTLQVVSTCINPCMAVHREGGSQSGWIRSRQTVYFFEKSDQIFVIAAQNDHSFVGWHTADICALSAPELLPAWRFFFLVAVKFKHTWPTPHTFAAQHWVVGTTTAVSNYDASVKDTRS